MSKPERVDRDRLSKALLNTMQEKGWNQQDLAKAIGMSQSAINDYLLKRKAPGPASLKKIVSALPITWEDVAPVETMGAEGKAVAQPVPAGRRAEIEDQVVHLQVYDAKAAAGNGYVNYESRLLATLDVPVLVLYQILGFKPPRRLNAIYVSGDSMEPTFRDGQLVIYEPTPRMQDHGRYILEMDGELLVKRVQRYVGGMIRLISDNQSAQYEDEFLKPLDGEPNLYVNEKYNTSGKLRVVGRVIWPHDRDAIDVKRTAELLRVLVSAGVLRH